MHDKPILEYYISKNNNLNLVWKIYKKEKYWILFPEDSPLKEKINLILLELKANWKYEKIYNKYFWEY
jgi:ABC-type amino acid transport substrate-binding protein